MNKTASSHPRSITESPWYWAYLFCTAGLIALVVMGPKYVQRQTQIEQNGQKRQWAAQLASGRAQGVSPTESEALSVNLWPLFVVLGLGLTVAWITLFRDQMKRRARAAEWSTSVDAGAGESGAGESGTGEPGIGGGDGVAVGSRAAEGAHS